MAKPTAQLLEEFLKTMDQSEQTRQSRRLAGTRPLSSRGTRRLADAVVTTEFPMVRPTNWEATGKSSREEEE